MRICIPILLDEGLQSLTSDHFGAAPRFMVVDTETMACCSASNRARTHEHGTCDPLASLDREGLDGVVVRGIGGNALRRLQSAGIPVYLTTQPTVEAVLEALASGDLREATPQSACEHHGHGLRRGCGSSGLPRD